MSYLLDVVSAIPYIMPVEQKRAEVTTHKEIPAAVMVVSAIVISGWVAWDATHGGMAPTEVAFRIARAFNVPLEQAFSYDD